MALELGHPGLGGSGGETTQAMWGILLDWAERALLVVSVARLRKKSLAKLDTALTGTLPCCAKPVGCG